MWHDLVEPVARPDPPARGARGRPARRGAAACSAAGSSFYELSYSAESLAHALFPGLVVAALLGLPLLLGAGAGVVGAALAVALAARVRGIDSDTGRGGWW